MGTTRFVIWAFQSFEGYNNAQEMPFSFTYRPRGNNFVAYDAADSLEAAEAVRRASESGFVFFQFFILSIDKWGTATVRDRTANSPDFFRKLRQHWKCRPVYILEFKNERTATLTASHISNSVARMRDIARTNPIRGDGLVQAYCVNLLKDAEIVLPNGKGEIPANVLVYAELDVKAVKLGAWDDVVLQIGEYDKE